MKIRVKKLFNNKVSIRNYIVNGAMQNNVSLVIEYNNQTMVLTPVELRTGTIGSDWIPSKWGSQRYRLVDYPWNPQDNKQSKLL